MPASDHLRHRAGSLAVPGEPAQGRAAGHVRDLGTGFLACSAGWGSGSEGMGVEYSMLLNDC